MRFKRHKKKPKLVFPRLFVLLASESSNAVIIRRGPSKQTAAIGWNRSSDTFTLGQWFPGKIYHFRADISPDGKYWIYFAMDEKGKAGTAVAQMPYLKALDFYVKDNTYNGGGLFLSDTVYWLNEGDDGHDVKKKGSHFKVKYEPHRKGECPFIYFKKLERDGWILTEGNNNPHVSATKFVKSIHENWVLQKIFFGTIGASGERPIGKGTYYEAYSLLNRQSLQSQPFPNWEWVEFDQPRNRLVWTESGKIMAAAINADGLGNIKMLYDTNSLTFSKQDAH
ncbi:MAG: hypothetical protein LBJ67_13460 [Planctomycetaceae bacterium]|nr:hypothetical protein [Planctomycetaceae bacterium]